MPFVACHFGRNRGFSAILAVTPLWGRIQCTLINASLRSNHRRHSTIVLVGGEIHFPAAQAFQIERTILATVVALVVRKPCQHDKRTLVESLDRLDSTGKYTAILTGGDHVSVVDNCSVRLHLISLSRCGFHHHARSLLSIFGNRKLESCEFLDSFFRRSILCETVKSDFQIFPKPLPVLELRPMDTLAKSNLTISMPPPLVGLVKVSPPYRFGMGFARGYPTFGGYARVVRLFSVRLFTTLHRGLSPPHIRGVCSLSPNRGVFLFSLQWGVEPPKRGGGPKTISTIICNWPV